MNRLHALFRRASAVAAGALLGLTGVAIFAAPASAHHSEITGQAKCDVATGEWVVDWSIKTYAPKGVKKYKLVEVVAKTYVGGKATEVTIPEISVTDGDKYPHSVKKALTANLRVDSNVTMASLAVRAEWDNGFVEDRMRTAKVKFCGTCKPPKPTPTPSASEPPAPTPTPSPSEPPAPTVPNPSASIQADCEGIAHVTLNNADDATAPAEFTVEASAGAFTEKVSVKPGESTSVEVPAEQATDIKVTVEGSKEPLFHGDPEPADNCVKPGEPTGAYKSTCDELIFEINNPEDGETTTATFTPNKGEPQTLTVEPGMSGTVSFPAEEGLIVTPSGEGIEDPKPIAWEKPEDCTPGEGGGDPGLPVTGAAAGGIAAGAAVLLAVGGGLFVMARRRKLRFTA
ncbi:hypothetical protein [Salinispora oceanensis]|uniref:hypothetical protein n=1 Tax=Salinispora oceanensis TaxID=1050199 RepID=UPI00039EA0F6|nr:hypothetical protein [Salinispora oceanensis]